MKIDNILEEDGQGRFPCKWGKSLATRFHYCHDLFGIAIDCTARVAMFNSLTHSAPIADLRSSAEVNRAGSGRLQAGW